VEQQCFAGAVSVFSWRLGSTEYIAKAINIVVEM
jgi:hypothetical protein